MSSTATPVPSSNSSSNSSTTTSTTTDTSTANSATFNPTGQITAQTTANASAASGAGTGSFTSMADFQQKAPQVYKAMMQSIATNICNDSQDWNNLIIDAMKEGEDNNP